MRRFLALLRCLSVPARSRELTNAAQPEPRDYIRSQWAHPGYRVGWGGFGRVGCEIAAVYNVLLRLGRRPSLPELIRSFTAGRCLMLGGLGGTDPFTLGPWLEERGLRVTLYAERGSCRAFCDAVARRDAPAYIMSYWTNPWRTNLHTVAFTAGPGGGLTAYNCGAAAVYDSPEQMAAKLPRRFILGYVIRD